MTLKVIKCYGKGSSRVRMAMGLQMRLTIARRVSVWKYLPWKFSCHPDSQSIYVVFGAHQRVLTAGITQKLSPSDA